MNIEARRAEFSDARTLLSLIRAAYAEYVGRLTPPSGAHAETEESIRALLSTEGSCIAEAGEEAIGCLFFSRRHESIYVHSLAVLPEWRRQGIGRALIERVEESARAGGYKWVTLGCRSSLPQNRRYYEALGFRGFALTPHSGSTVPTAILMRKRVGQTPERLVRLVEWDPAWAALFEERPL